MRIALIGAGAIGTILGALISKEGEDIELVDTNKEHVATLSQNGATIAGLMNCTVPVKAIMPGDMSGKYDLIISLTKHLNLEDSLAHTLQYIHDETVVLTLQNGIPEDVSQKFVGPERVMGGGVEFGATLLAPGTSELTSDPSSLKITFGRLDGEITEKTKEVQKIFSKFGESKISSNMVGTRFSKLTDNATFSGMSTVLNCNNGQILDSSEAMICIAHLGREAGLVIEKMGIQPENIFGLQPLLDNVGFTTKREMEELINNYWRPIYKPYRAGIASMLQDIRKGKMCEINQINGKFVELGEQLGVDVPYMRTVVEVVTKLQNGELRLEDSWDNINYFDTPQFS